MASVKKMLTIDPTLVRRARKICGTRSEAETITRALREVLIRDEVDKAFKRHGRVLADIEEVFPDGALPRR